MTQITFQAIDNGIVNFSLKLLKHGNERCWSEYAVSVNGKEQEKTISLLVSRARENGPMLDIWETTRELRKAGYLGQEGTLVSGTVFGGGFFEMGNQRLHGLSSRETARLDTPDSI